jgi:hypothetical protein
VFILSNHMKPINTLCGQNAGFLVFKQMVHVVNHHVLKIECAIDFLMGETLKHYYNSQIF